MENFDTGTTTSWAIMIGLIVFAGWRFYKSRKKSRRLLK
jgi:LPXTG-motif cell wall-anchored protein